MQRNTRTSSQGRDKKLQQLEEKPRERNTMTEKRHYSTPMYKFPDALKESTTVIPGAESQVNPSPQQQQQQQQQQHHHRRHLHKRHRHQHAHQLRHDHQLQLNGHESLHPCTEHKHQLDQHDHKHNHHESAHDQPYDPDFNIDTCTTEELIAHSRKITDYIKKRLTPELRAEVAYQQARFERLVLKYDYRNNSSSTKPKASSDDDDDEFFSAKSSSESPLPPSSSPSSPPSPPTPPSSSPSPQSPAQGNENNNEHKIDKQIADMNSDVTALQLAYYQMPAAMKHHFTMLKVKVEVLTVLWDICKTFLPRWFLEDLPHEDWFETFGFGATGVSHVNETNSSNNGVGTAKSFAKKNTGASANNNE